MSSIIVTKKFAQDYLPSVARSKLSKASYRLVSGLMRVAASGNTTSESFINISRKDLLQTLNDTTYTDGSQKPVASSWVTKYVKQLESLGIVELETVKRPNNRGVGVYSACNFTALEKIPPKRPRAAYNTNQPVKRAIELLDDDLRLTPPVVMDGEYAVQDGLIVGILDTVMRTSSTDPRTEITKELVFGSNGRNGKVKITSTTSTESGAKIMEHSDQRLVLYIMWAAKEQARRRNFELEALEDGTERNQISDWKFQNKYVIDLKVAAERMKVMTNGRANVLAANNMLRRLFHTSFNIDATASVWFQENFSNESSSTSQIFDFRIIDSMDAKLDAEDHEILSPRIIQLTLNQKLHESIVGFVLGRSNARVFGAHPGLMSEDNGTIQRFNGWVSPRWGRGKIKENLENMWYPIDTLAFQMALPQRLDNFRKIWLRVVFRKALEQGRVPKNEKGEVQSLKEVEEFTALIYGYWVLLKKEDKAWFTNIKRDRKDAILGVNTLHSKKIEAANAEILNKPTEPNDNYSPIDDIDDVIFGENQ